MSYTSSESLQTVLNFNGSPKDGEEEAKISLSREVYNVEVVFNVAETHHNMEQGNVYVQARLKSYYPLLYSDMVFNRMGTLEYKGRLHLYIKEIFNFIPMGKYILRYVLM